jgi:hypothetical protein
MTTMKIPVGERFVVTGFSGPDIGSTFVNLKIGKWTEAEIQTYLTPDEARKLADALLDAANYADAELVTEAA